MKLSILLFTVIFLNSKIYCQKNTTAILDSIAYSNMEYWIKPKGLRPRINFQFYFNYQDQYIFNGAIGKVKKGDSTVPLNYKYKSASVAKTFTATLIMQLVEEGKINLNAPITTYLDETLVKPLIRIKGIEYGHKITVLQLLNHTAGLSDYIFEDKRFILKTEFFPRRSRTPLEHLETYMKHKMYKKGTFIPGTSFRYTDTGYLLLALIIEKVSGNSLANQYQQKIVTPLGLKNTYLDNWDSTYTNMMHQYQYTRDFTILLHPSVEFGGGGLITSNQDLALFIKGLFGNKLFKDSATLQLMLPTNTNDYGFGISTFKIPESYFDPSSKDSLEVYGHMGYFGIDLYHIPERNITWVNSIGQARPKYRVSKDTCWVTMMLNCYRLFKE